MKNWSAHRIRGGALLCVILLLVFIGTWLSSRGLTHDCSVGTSDHPQRIHAIKVVVRPWLGQHQVFGIFMVPLRYRSGRSYSGTISVQSFSGAFRPDQQPEVQRVEDVIVEPGYYLVRGYVPTRIALWFLVTGQYGELRSPCNWTLEFSERLK
jgi:hypothetical protein